ncbi:hypothetical protein [Candidatus Halobonum tyrrellensis]|uniref:Uncharacterized protein n=1 Tax=Candidatus Halobonum tyrrellensis G22 TaxID=1324957 RepID=V4HAM9_9EURY|nr:hypothetical protein [Candidatus Halobonum tyrrellensis]ESP87113.1 hypothetical protein K933_16387 [Candidatus Halobonum tyrrellensis G22]
MTRTRYEPECDDGTLFLVAGDDRVEIGAVDDVVDAVGNETFSIEYDEKQRTQPWLETDEGVLDVDVRETVTTLAHTPETVADLREYGMETDAYGLPTRTVEFANVVVDILSRQGSESEQ